MATEKYLNLQGLTEVAGYVNEKLKVVTAMPASPNEDDIVIYNGATTADYRQGRIYIYDLTRTYYQWSDSTDNYYTVEETPAVGDTVFSDTSGTVSGYTIEAYDELNNQVTINSLTYDRNSAGDAPIYKWVSKSGITVVLNGIDRTGNEANFYAPINSGADGQFLVSKGIGAPPQWANFDPEGFTPSFLDNSLVFTTGNVPEVDGNSLVFDYDGG